MTRSPIELFWTAKNYTSFKFDKILKLSKTFKVRMKTLHFDRPEIRDLVEKKAIRKSPFPSALASFTEIANLRRCVLKGIL